MFLSLSPNGAPLGICGEKKKPAFLNVMKLPESWTRERARSLKALGMRDYADYLASPIWAAIRRRVYRRAHGICEACGERQATAIHHWGYTLKAMQGRNLNALQAVCESCHKRHHKIKADSPKKAAKKQMRREWRAWVAAGGAVGQPVLATPRLVRRP